MARGSIKFTFHFINSPAVTSGELKFPTLITEVTVFIVKPLQWSILYKSFIHLVMFPWKLKIKATKWNTSWVRLLISLCGFEHCWRHLASIKYKTQHNTLRFNNKCMFNTFKAFSTVLVWWIWVLSLWFFVLLQLYSRYWINNRKQNHARQCTY